MIDLKLIRENPQLVEENLGRRNKDYSLKNILKLDEDKRKYLVEVERLKSVRNAVSKEIGQLKKEKIDCEDKIAEMTKIGDTIKGIDDKVRKIDEELNGELLALPNIISEEVPLGKGEEDNVEVKKFGTPREFDFEFKDHHELGTTLNIIDFEAGGKVTGSKFAYMVGYGAKIERALINFMLDVHGESGYEEILAPFLVNEKSLYGTGQLPKFKDDAFLIEKYGYYLIPTGEVPITNYYRDHTFKGEELPKNFVGVTPCFRSEAGSAGRDTRGLIRLHQFNKVELVKFVEEDKSLEELENITRNAEKILELLELPYRRVILSSGDIGFGSFKTYDLEVYLPSYGTYKEISSCSLYKDFQSRRSNIKYKTPEKKNKFVHTLNGSGLAVGRTVAAILENYQNEDGTITVPKVLVKYLGCEVIK